VAPEKRAGRTLIRLWLLPAPSQCRRAPLLPGWRARKRRSFRHPRHPAARIAGNV